MTKGKIASFHSQSAWGNPMLERLVCMEAVVEILEALTPCELVVALLRAEGLSDGEIGEFLGIGRWAVQVSDRVGE